jgi:carboxypeptidase Taq
VRVRRRDYDQLVRVPGELVEAMARTTSLAKQAWRDARVRKDYELFRPHLEEVIALRVRWAECFRPFDNPYDPLLDAFEPGMTYAGIRQVFDGLKPRLVDLVAKIAKNADAVDDAVLRRSVDEVRQIELCRGVTERLGYDYARGRLDLSAHPFSSRFVPGDVRITTRVTENDPVMSLMSSVHEAGHAMHAQALSPTLYRTGLDVGNMQAIAESQSRFFENVIGRSLPFWRWLHPILQYAYAPAFDDTTAEALYRGVNKVEPGFIRVDADEVTYGLHIMLRFELENELMNGRISAAELPGAWNDRMEAYLGIRPPHDGLGVLQDIHWSSGYIGYFPDYLLGSLFAVQLWDRMKQDVPDVEARLEQGDFAPPLAWLEERVMRHGRKFTLPELAERAVGGPLRWEPYMAYLHERYGTLYGV